MELMRCENCLKIPSRCRSAVRGAKSSRFVDGQLQMIVFMLNGKQSRYCCMPVCWQVEVNMKLTVAGFTVRPCTSRCIHSASETPDICK